MTEKEFLEQLRIEADSIEIPEKLRPENMIKVCMGEDTISNPEEIRNENVINTVGESKYKQVSDIEATGNGQEINSGEINKEEKNKGEINNREISDEKIKGKEIGKEKHIVLSHWYPVAIAACLCLILGISWYQMKEGHKEEKNQIASVENQVAENTDTAGDVALDGDARKAEEIKEGELTEKTTEDIEGQAADEAADETADKTSNGQNVKRHNAGDLFCMADSYSKVYDAVYDPRYGEMANEGNIMVGESWQENLNMDIATAASDSAAQKEFLVSDYSQEGTYSKTNTQLLGVDESDIVKTDGKYMYCLEDGKISILDITKEKIKKVSEINNLQEGAGGKVLEMYVDGDILNIIMQKSETTMELNDSADETPYEDVYYMNDKVKTTLFTYDISDRKNPKCNGSFVVDGAYKTSRKIGNLVYLFTDNYLSTTLHQKEAVNDAETLKKGNGGWIPEVGDQKIAAADIYLSERGQRGLVCASVDITNPEKSIDRIMIVNEWAQIYVSTQSLYLYYDQYDDHSGIVTNIAKFSLKKGMFDAVGATAVNGEVRDTFAVNEYNNKLRILTTDWENENQNNLYLFDEKLKLTGSLTGLAKGEMIYSARFMNQTAYFVTYRNMDPLFAVDLSDEKNPKVMSELKITGFSEYLHFWGKDKLVGIGYETDPETSERKGLKISMFDISNPSDLKVISSVVISGAEDSPALYNYKSVLVDHDQNLIGFLTMKYDNEGQRRSHEYLLFSFTDNKFEKILSEKTIIDTNYYGTYELAENTRGLFNKDRYYIYSGSQIRSYDRNAGYSPLEKFEVN